ncbi:MAG: hypothetical protein UU16_C0009G0009 [Candidatus Woesebacteria bacterium GW2011_GWA2_40_7]|uniref:Uncharacterized protein n=3 Tax=Candidatus Woeseibacteriota TaxID=1752722 RepID=A0A0G0LV95_9BACT|nr:MAG: hypothetical protein UT17_C0004G0273 [Candidatus Woesebacteria bacterium GW2011_GWB1_39_10]KKR73939.1 MAG: hypothetical protein UU16_C0009G0009 [Candidatus Woesebacteria bacterium GW2011_GWA2_40_7]KKS90916.1 MAG: hypothetical protein UV66_C0001G0273 [Candidatus Woesebacteria bacterium GW2011_GWA1_43_12]
MMNEDMKWMKMKWMHKAVQTDFLMSISFSVFGMLLIFGLGFVFPTINPYVVIKWIIIVAGVVFALSFLKYLVYMGMKMKMMKMMKKEMDVMPETKTKKGSKK